MLDPAAVAGSRGEWRRASLPDPRSRSDLRQAPRRFDQSLGSQSIAIPRCEPEGEFAVRAGHRNGTARVLGLVDPVSEAHLRAILRCWVTHYNGGRPHSALGPGVPDPPENQKVIPKPEARHRLAVDALVLAKSVLGGLHHEYSVGNVQSRA